jgi:hypothetical protein
MANAAWSILAIIVLIVANNAGEACLDQARNLEPCSGFGHAASSVMSATIVAWIAGMALIGRFVPSRREICPHCLKGIPYGASACHHCGRSIEDDGRP